MQEGEIIEGKQESDVVNGGDILEIMSDEKLNMELGSQSDLGVF